MRKGTENPWRQWSHVLPPETGGGSIGKAAPGRRHLRRDGYGPTGKTGERELFFGLRSYNASEQSEGPMKQM